MARWGDVRIYNALQTGKKYLMKINSAANCFENPTYENNFLTVNLEAIVYGTNVVTYNTGGCGETLELYEGVESV